MRFLIAFLFCVSLNAQVYVVAGGAGSQNGTSEANGFATIQAGVNAATTGQIVYVKAGNYGNATVTVNKTITLEGYKTTPGDLTTASNTANGAAFVGGAITYPHTFSSAEMPVLDQTTQGSGTAINITSANAVVRNFQLRDYGVGVNVSGPDGVTVFNVICDDMGTYTGTTEVYSGKGIQFTSASNFGTIKNCYIENGGAEGIMVSQSNDCVVQNCKVYADRPRATTSAPNNALDYAIVVTGSQTSGNVYARRNQVINCTVSGTTATTAPFHGITLKGETEDNIISNCTINRSTLEFSREECVGNTANGVTITGGTEGDGILVRDGAYNNQFTNVNVTGASGVYFWSTVSQPDDAFSDTAGRGNTFTNCVFNGGYAAIDFYYYSNTDPAVDNVFIDCTFSNKDVLFNADRPSTGTQLLGTTITNVAAVSASDRGNNSQILWEHYCTTATGSFTLKPEDATLSAIYTCQDPGNPGNPGGGGPVTTIGGAASLIISH